MNRYIIIKTQFEGIHSWPDCPIKEVSFLKTPHRHIFYVTLVKEVSHNERDIEIIQLKRRLDYYISNILLTPDKELGTLSCESIAENLLLMFKAFSVEILEDNENGAKIQQ
jgi:hypothetical protein